MQKKKKKKNDDDTLQYSIKMNAKDVHNIT